MSDKNNETVVENVPGKKRGRPAKGNDARVTVRLSDTTMNALEDYGNKHGMSVSDVIRTFLNRYGSAVLMADKIGEFKNGVNGLTLAQEAILEEYRRSDTTESLLNEIFASTHFMTSTVWCNTAYSGHLYESKDDKKKVADELRKSAITISELFNSLAERIEEGRWDKKVNQSVRQNNHGGIHGDNDLYSPGVVQ